MKGEMRINGEKNQNKPISNNAHANMKRERSEK
jgi:hypothetical protein